MLASCLNLPLCPPALQYCSEGDSVELPAGRGPLNWLHRGEWQEGRRKKRKTKREKRLNKWPRREPSLSPGYSINGKHKWILITEYCSILVMSGSLSVCVPFGSNSASMIQESAWAEHSGGRRCFSASASTAIMRNWILKNWLSLETKDGYVHLFHPTLTTPSVSASPCGTWPKSLPFPAEASALYFLFPPFPPKLSPVSPIFSTRGSRQVTLLCFIACCLFWQGVWHKRCGRLSPTRTAPSLHSVQCQPFAPTPACLVQLQSRGTWQTELLWSRSNRKSMRKDFPYSGGVRQGIKVCFKPF